MKINRSYRIEAYSTEWTRIVFTDWMIKSLPNGELLYRLEEADGQCGLAKKEIYRCSSNVPEQIATIKLRWMGNMDINWIGRESHARA
jgi:hypothetical protein